MAGSQIKVVARITGLSARLIRIWEDRYAAVVPQRAANQRRSYSPAEIERLKLLRDLTRAGHSIGAVARLPERELRRLAEETGGVEERATESPNSVPSAEQVMADCLSGIRALDPDALEGALQRGMTALGTMGMIQRILAPLAQNLGEFWIQGSITAAHEHFASAIIRNFLFNTLHPAEGTKNAPVMIVATPSGQQHELGALLAAAVAANLGWKIAYLGTSLPSSEIAGAARHCQARAVALSIVYPEDDPALGKELRLLRRLLPQEVAIVLGGRGAPAYLVGKERPEALLVKDLTELIAVLGRLRSPVKSVREVSS